MATRRWVIVIVSCPSSIEGSHFSKQGDRRSLQPFERGCTFLPNKPPTLAVAKGRQPRHQRSHVATKLSTALCHMSRSSSTRPLSSLLSRLAPYIEMF